MAVSHTNSTRRFSSFRAVRELALRTGQKSVLRSWDRAAIVAIVAAGALGVLVESVGAFAIISALLSTHAARITVGGLIGLPKVEWLQYVPPLSLLIAIVVAQRIISPWLFYRTNRYGELIAYRLRVQLLTLATSVPSVNAGAIPSGELASILNEEVGRCGRSVAAVVVASQLSLGILVTAFAVLIQDAGTTLAASAFAVPMLGVYFVAAARTSADTNRAVSARIQAQSKATEGLRSLAAIQAVGGGRELLSELSGNVSNIKDFESRIYFNQMRLGYLMLMVPIAAGIGALLFGFHRNPGKDVSIIVSSLLPIGAVGLRLALAISGSVTSLYGVSVTATSIAPTLALEARLLTLASKPRRASSEGSESSPVAVELKDVGFRLPDGKWLFRNLGATIAAGRPLLVRGPSGTGKSTLATLLAGANDPTEGSVLYGLSNRKMTAPDPTRINYLSQDPAVVAGTVRDNLRLGNGDIDLDDVALEAALRKARLWDEITVKQGLDTLIFEGGRNLSGGQIRRLGIARLLTRHRNIWIFDEPTASLDAANSRMVEEIIRQFADESIVVVVSHDPSFSLTGTIIELGSLDAVSAKVS